MDRRDATTRIDVPETLYERLREVARARGTVFYGEVAPLVGIDTANPHFASLVGWPLDEVNRIEVTDGRPMLSAVVISKNSNMPGSGFFTCARDLRRYAGKDDLAFWLEELQRVHAYWSRH